MEPEENVGTSLDSFAEREEVQSLLDHLPSVCNDLREMERAEERFTGSANRCMYGFLRACQYQLIRAFVCSNSGQVPGAATPP